MLVVLINWTKQKEIWLREWERIREMRSRSILILPTRQHPEPKTTKNMRRRLNEQKKNQNFVLSFAIVDDLEIANGNANMNRNCLIAMTMEDKRWLLCADLVVVQGGFWCSRFEDCNFEKISNSRPPVALTATSAFTISSTCWMFPLRDVFLWNDSVYQPGGSVMSYACSDKTVQMNALWRITSKRDSRSNVTDGVFSFSLFDEITSHPSQGQLRDSRHQAAVSSSNSNDNKISGINVYNFNSRFLCTDFNCHALFHSNVDWFVLPRTMKRQNFVCKVAKQIRSNRARFAQSHMQMLMEIVFLMFLHFVEVLSESQIA